MYPLLILIINFEILLDKNLYYGKINIRLNKINNVSFGCYYFMKFRRKEQMKSTGIVRPLDELGRIVIPIELRRTYDIGPKDALEIYVDGDKIILKKFQRSCTFCGNKDGVAEFKGKFVCADCVKELTK